MPPTGRVVHAEYKDRDGTQIEVLIRPPSMRPYFTTCVISTFPGVIVTRMGDDGLHLRCKQWMDGSRVMKLLKLLEASVTIDHGCPWTIDESHAIWLHSIHDAAGQASTSELGKLTSRAKSNMYKAEALAKRFGNWIEQHPRYKNCDFVAAVPPSNRHAKFYLPEVLSSSIGERLGVPRVQIHSRNIVSQEAAESKTNPQQLSAMFTVTPSVSLTGKRVALLDDTCESGGSIVATGIALKASGAREVIVLCASKTATECNGLPANVANWGEERS